MPEAKKRVGTIKKVAPKAEFVTKKEFDNFANALTDLLKERLPAPGEIPAATVPAVAPEQERAIAKAGPNAYITDEDWDLIAQEILGDAVDHTEVERKGGGIKFTVVIRKEKSNASPEYLERHKVDRRTREVGAEGTEGVSAWCKLIKQNLARPR